ncbi:venom metalloproteinase antarease-like TtrivMP_A, partial [Centruroides sculpturatus]|uniref:venom metalloproteinase antarease-like TtrivMP_A n=1 Tax=Centruroides sculpturatus TaxID=218467 RepID=UPI000C6EC812
FYVIVVLFSSPILAIPSGRTELTYPFLETLRSGEKILTLRTFGNDIELKLEPAGDVIADDFTVMDGNGKIHKTDVKNLKSKLFRNKEKDAALYINEEGPLKIKGMLTSKLRIEPYESQDTVRDGIKAHRITETLVETKRFNDAGIRVIGEKNNVGWIFDNLLGLSYFGGTCDPCRKYGAIVDLDKLSDTASIVAHESAHLIGSPHDGAGVNLSLPGSPEADKCPGSDGFFMGSDSGKNRRKFSTCSLENIKFFLK